MKRKLLSGVLYIGIISWCAHVSAQVIVYGDEQAGTHTSVSVPLGAWAYSVPNSHLYVGAANSGAKNLAVACLQKGADALMPLAPEKANINGQEDIDNPLYNSPIAHMQVLSVPAALTGTNDTLVVVPAKKDQADIYLLADTVITQTMHMLAMTQVLDAHREPSSGIVALATTGAHSKSGIFAAVKPHGENTHFGDDGSGIALVSVNSAPAESKMRYLLFQIDADPYPYKKSDLDEKKPLVRASRCDKKTMAFAGEHELAAFGDDVDMWWDTRLQSLYIATSVTTGDSPDALARSVAVAHVGKIAREDKGARIVIQPLIADSALSDIRGIIHARGVHATVSTRFVRTMHVSTGFSYLITVDGDQMRDECGVFALPLLTGKQCSTQGIRGMVASKKALPFVERDGVTKSLQQPIASADDCPLRTDSACAVGAGAVLCGEITDITCEHDAVFVTIGGADGGVFFSQAIFNEHGLIKAWTPWQRAIADRSSLSGAFLDAATGNWDLITGSDVSGACAVKRTQWFNGEESLIPFSSLCDEVFAQQDGGVLGLFEFTKQGLMIATGKAKILMVKPEAESIVQERKVAVDPKTKKIIPLAKKPKVRARTQDLPEHVILTGNVLDTIGLIVAAELVEHNGCRQIWVGGMGGLAVMHESDHQPSFEMVGSYKNVRKLMYDAGNLYVLTTDRLDRIAIADGSHTIHTVVTAPKAIGKGCFFDMVVSSNCAVVGTSHGVMLVSQLDGDTCGCVQQISLGQESYVVPHVYAVTPTGKSTDCARGCGGNIYVTCTMPGYNSGHVYRLTVEPHDESVKVLPITGSTTIAGYVTELVGYCHAFITDGSMFIQAKNKTAQQEPLCANGIAVTTRTAHHLNMDLAHAHAINAVLRSSLLGTWVLSGDFGMMVNA